MNKQLLYLWFRNFVELCLFLYLPYTFWCMTVPMPQNISFPDTILRKVWLNPSSFFMFCIMSLFLLFRFIYFCKKQKIILLKTTIGIEIFFLVFTLLQGASPMPGASSEYGRQIRFRQMANRIYSFCLSYADQNSHCFPDRKTLESSAEWRELEEFHRKDPFERYQSRYHGEGKTVNTPKFLLFEDAKINQYPRFPYHLSLYSDGEISIQQE